MCMCGTVEKDGFYQCCQDQIAMNQESRYFGGQMSKAEMVRWDMERDKKANEQREKELEAFERQVNKSHFEAKKNKVASAYRPIKGIIAGEIPANEIPREELLLRDVGIMLEENRRLRAENERLITSNKLLLEKNEIMFKALRDKSTTIKISLEKKDADM